MISIKFTWLHITIFIASFVVGKFVIINSIKWITKQITSTQWYIGWFMNKQMKAKKKAMNTKRKQIHNELRNLEAFINQIDKKLGNNRNRKQFWKDFCTSKATRQYWIKKMTDDFAPQVKETNKKEG